MTTPYHADDSVTLHHGDSLAVLRTLPDASVDCCVTSPPYFGLRDYGEPGQYGLEASPAEYVETMRALFAEVRRVLTDDGTLWLNLGDSYSATTRSDNRTSEQRAASSTLGPKRDGLGGSNAGHTAVSFSPVKMTMDRPTKNLLGMPWRTAFALQDDGWILRNDIIWAKPNAMPESVTDRLSTRHEHLFMFSRAPRYWFDLDPIREARVREDRTDVVENVSKLDGLRSRPDNPQSVFSTGQHLTSGRNPGDVWTVPTQPFTEAHFAVMPHALAERAILAGCKPGGVVLDPFSGSGTTGLAATKHGRKYVGIDLSRDYLDLSLRTRFAQPGFMFDGESA